METKEFVNDFIIHSLTLPVLVEKTKDDAQVYMTWIMNATLFSFEYDDCGITWYFSGDYTSKYFEGDIISLKTKVVEEIVGNSEFESLDILKETKNTNKAPELSSYLVN